MKFERTHDMQLVKEIISTPEIYRWAADDGCPPREQFEPVDSEAIWYVLASSGAKCAASAPSAGPVQPGRLLGMFAFIPENSFCWDVHNQAGIMLLASSSSASAGVANAIVFQTDTFHHLTAALV